MRVVVIADAQLNVRDAGTLAVLHDAAGRDEADKQGQRDKYE